MARKSLTDMGLVAALWLLGMACAAASTFGPVPAGTAVTAPERSPVPGEFADAFRTGFTVLVWVTAAILLYMAVAAAVEHRKNPGKVMLSKPLTYLLISGALAFIPTLMRLG